jgi:uncharacterized protein (DUF4415 family)
MFAPSASNPPTDSEAEELAELAVMPEEAIDTTDIPEQRDWSGARRGVFWRPVKRQLTLRLDADVVDFFASQGKCYQTRMNEAHREAPADPQ